MAKKKQKFELDDDFGFGADLDIPDFDFDNPGLKDDRSAVTKVASGVKEGFKDTVKSPAYIRKLVVKSLPDGYGQALDLADNTAGTIKNLYNDAAKEVKPVVKDLKRVTRRLLPAAESYLPRKMAEKIKNWTTETDSGSGMLSAEAMREASLQAQMGEIFQFQTEQQAKDKAENEARETMRDSIEHDRHRDMLGQLDAMRVSLQQLAGYQDKVDTAYKRKSLELQFRHYFVAVDMLEEQKKYNAESKANLDGILKNTGLPDYVKLKNTERLKEVMRNKFIDGLNDSVFSRRRDMIANIGKKLSSQILGKVRDVASDFGQGLSTIDMIGDMTGDDGMAGMGPSKEELGGSVAGGMIADSLGTRGAKWVRKNMRRIDPDGKVDKFGNKLTYGVENAPQMLVDYARSDKHETGGLFDGLVRAFKDAIISSNTVDNSVQADSLRGMQMPMPYNRAAHKSIVEIIPGYLARIYRELQITRTGDTGIELTSYDFGSSKFVERSSLKKKVLSGVVSKFEKDATHDQVDKLLKEIDPEGKLNAEERKALGQFLIRENLRNASGDPERLKDGYNYGGSAARHGFKFAELFENHFDDDPDYRKRLNFTRRYNELGRYISDSRGKVQDHVNVGDRDLLEELGLLSPNHNDINMDRLYGYFYGDEEAPIDPATGQPAAPSAASNSPGRRASRTRSAARAPQQRTPQRRRPSPSMGPQPAISTPPASVPQPAAPAPASTSPVSTSPLTASVDLTELIATIKGTSETTVKTIKEESSKSWSEKIHETLLRIEKQVEQGMTINIGRGGQGGGNGRQGGPWWNRSVSELGSGLFGSVSDMARRGRDRAREGMGWIKDGASKLRDKAMETFNDVRDKGDIFIRGEVEPRLQGARLRAGKYRDVTTGKIIESYKDIKGAVIDIETGEFVLKKEDLKNVLVKSKVARKLVSWSTLGYGKLSDFVKSIPDGYQNLFNFAKKTKNLISEVLLDAPQDIYVKGKEDPVIYARVMRAGGYFSKVSGEKIERPSQIKGAVVDENGDVVLTTEEFAKGIFTKTGKPVRTGKAALTGAVGDFLRYGAQGARRLFDFGKDLMGRGFEMLGGLKGKFNGVGKWFGELFEKGGIFFGGGKNVVERLTEIRDLLSERLPQRKKHVVGDVDGDGVRENSYQDLKRKEKEKLIEATGQGPKDKAAAGEAGLLSKLGGIKGLIDKLRGKKDDEEEEGGVLDSAEDMAKGVAEEAIGDRLGNGGRRGRRGRAGRAAGRGGRMSRFGGKLKGLLGGGRLLKGLGVAGAAYGGYSAYQNLKEGNYGSAAVDAGLSAMSLGASTAGVGATLSAAGSLATGALTAGGSLLAGAAGLISAPVLLTAAAIAALGVGAYYGYKYLTRKKLDTWSKIRYAQYGFLPTDTDHVQKVLGLEDDLKKGVIFKNGIAQLEEKKIDFKDVVKKFDIDLGDKVAVAQWLRWFLERFKPVYLVHMSALAKVAPQKDLSDIESLKPEEKKQYLEIAKYLEGPYDVSISPFKELKSLPADKSVVKNLVDAAYVEIEKAGGKPTSASGMAAVAAAAPTVASMAQGANGVQTPTAPKVSNEALGMISSNDQPDSGMNDSRGVITAMGVPLAANKFSTGKIDALTAVRYKTYGLKELLLDKVRAIDSLETYVNKEVSYGKGNVAKWEGSAEKALIAMGPAFGVQASTGNDSTNWLVWFSQRFLPVYMNYLTAIATATDKTDPKQAYTMLKPSQMVDVAMVIYTANSRYSGTSMSVWQVPASPWPNYELNSDVKSVELNVNGLKEDAKRTVLDEAKGKTPKGKDAQANPTAPTSFIGKVGNVLSNAWQGVKDTVSGMFGGPQAPNTNGGRDILQPGNGTGGDINSIPKPKGNKTWAALKDTILAAAKMVGVDEKMMATFAAIESGFDYTIKAGSSSAAGLYQFVNDTWKYMLKRYGAKYGIDPNTSQTDPRANALMGAEYMKESVDSLQSSLKRPITDTDVYMAHFLGPGGAKKFLNANPNAIAANVMPDAARANVTIFYDKTGRPRTVAEVYAEMNNRVRSKGKQFDMDAGAENIKTSSSDTNKPVPAATATDNKGGAKASNALAVPVADAAPGAIPSVNGGGKQAPPAPVTASDKAQPVPSDVAAFGMGYASSKSRDATVQSQYQRDVKDEIMGRIDETATKQLNVQIEIRESLKSLLELARGKAQAKPTESQAPAAAPQVTINRGPQAAPRPPVSMAKPAF